jgi:hypothetical protein
MGPCGQTIGVDYKQFKVDFSNRLKRLKYKQEAENERRRKREAVSISLTQLISSHDTFAVFGSTGRAEEEAGADQGDFSYALFWSLYRILTFLCAVQGGARDGATQ